MIFKEIQEMLDIKITGLSIKVLVVAATKKYHLDGQALEIKEIMDVIQSMILE